MWGHNSPINMTFNSILAAEVANKTHGKNLIVRYTKVFMSPACISIVSAARGDKGAVLATQDFDNCDVNAIKTALNKAQFV